MRDSGDRIAVPRSFSLGEPPPDAEAAPEGRLPKDVTVVQETYRSLLTRVTVDNPRYLIFPPSPTTLPVIEPLAEEEKPQRRAKAREALPSTATRAPVRKDRRRKRSVKPVLADKPLPTTSPTEPEEGPKPLPCPPSTEVFSKPEKTSMEAPPNHSRPRCRITPIGGGIALVNRVGPALGAAKATVTAASTSPLHTTDISVPP